MKNLILVLAFIFAITTFSQDLFSKEKGNKHKEKFRKELKEKLNLTDEQQKKVDEIKFAHQSAMIKYRADIDLKELELKKLMNSENISRAEMVKLTKEISTIKNEIALVRVNHKMDIYDLLDVNQKKVWMDTQDKIGMVKDKMNKRLDNKKHKY